MECPDIKEKVLELYKKEFLKLNHFKIGDELEVNFTYQQLHPKYNSRKMERFNHRRIAKGILRENEDGLYVESIDDFEFYEFTSNGLTGRARKDWYKQISKKAIFKIRCGLSF
ncbi:MAG: hypothetical protein DRI74_07655 [Bacteroidetes bacterium]|nr:MAG: hypothetical protein DRI74_07655 [Bacteroidota bacterium]